MTELDKLSKFYVYKTKKGLLDRIEKLPYEVERQAYLERLEYENQVIIQMGYPGYFLVVQDFINWAKSQGILVGPGRGSGAGALACFSLGITNVDPLPHGLIFERFLNPARVSMPDLDIDFPKTKRELVIEYVAERYGRDKVAQIGTFGTFKAKAAIKAVCKTLGHPVSLGERLTKAYPKPVHGKEVRLRDALQTSEDLKKEWAKGETEREILTKALDIEGRVSSYGIHASGVVIADQPLYELLPLAVGKRGETVTQWDMNNVEEAGLIKFDFLGLKNLDVLDTAMQHIKSRHGVEIDIENIPLDDDKVFSTLRKGDNIGLFQLESSAGMRDLLVKIRPTSIEDITALVAMYRPGPMKSPRMQDYLAWRAGLADPQYHHPDLEPILSGTGGWIVYQEQVLEIAKQLAGYTLAEADLLRRAVGKKKEKEMAQLEAQFTDGLRNNGYSADLASTLWGEIKAFADYGFNKSHAVSYAMLAYQCAYLKTYYPKEFMAAALTHDMGNMDQMIVYLQDCKRLGIEVLPPDVNDPSVSFIPTDEGIRFGLAAVKNVGVGPASHIIEIRKQAKFQNIFDFARRVDLGLINKKVLDSLTLAGAFDGDGKNRATLMQAVTSILDHKDEKKKYLSKLATYEKKQDAYLERLGAVERGERSIVKVKDKTTGEVIGEKEGPKLKAFKKPTKPEPPPSPTYIDVPEMSDEEMLLQERQLTGFFISGHPLHAHRDKINITLSRIKEYIAQEKPEGDTRVQFVCVFSEVKLHETKTKQRMAFIRVEDLTATCEGVIFAGTYKKFKEAIVPNVPLLVSGAMQYTEADPDENSEQDEVIVSIKVSAIKPLAKIKIEEKDISCTIPLTLTKVNSVKKVLDKCTGNDAQLELRLMTQSGAQLLPQQRFGIDDARTARTQLRKLGAQV